MSKWLVGSSSNTTCGRISRILHRPMRIFHPPEKEDTNALASSFVKPIVSNNRSARCSKPYAPFWSILRCTVDISSIREDASESPALASSSSSSALRVKRAFSSANTDNSSDKSVREPTSCSRNSCRSMATSNLADDLTMPPPSGRSSSVSRRSCVDLPQPLGPTSPTRSPVFTSQLALSSNNRSWNRSVTWSSPSSANPSGASAHCAMRGCRRARASVKSAAGGSTSTSTRGACAAAAPLAIAAFASAALLAAVATAAMFIVASASAATCAACAVAMRAAPAACATAAFAAFAAALTAA
mmetsp:Transcript_31675/g.78402  ORF Transcript_31675/g.78402 Transcript_31675/m.78402 type:complete len:300 (-) Transcript_31675:54-953(-)